LRLLTEWTPALPPVCLYYPHRKNSPAAVRAFIDLARKMAG